MNIRDLPLENKYKILLSLSPQELLKLCQTNRYFFKLCKSRDFWIYRANFEFKVTANEFNDTNDTNDTNLSPILRYVQPA